MRKLFFAACIVSLFCLGGCSKEKKDKKSVLNSVSGESGLLTTKGGIPIYPSDDDKIFDFSDGDVKDFVFIDEDDEKGSSNQFEVSSKKQVDLKDEWDESGEEELKLTWSDEEEGENFDFKVVNFDLNRNQIRDDQKNLVAENVKIAEEAVKSGKKVVVAGHCCELGSPSFNMSLSEKRAKTIRDEMVKGGVPKEKIKILGCGSEFPVVLSDSRDRKIKIEELSANRRAEVSIN